MAKSKRKILIQASNSCLGIDQQEVEKLFDRFYRPDKSRSAQTGGFGIGLSIAKSIAEAHGSSIKAECTASNEIQFTVELK